MVRSLYQQHHRPLQAFIRRLVGPERAEDVVQEVFFRLLRLENLETREISVSYLFRIGENLVRKGYHQEQRSRRTLEAAGRHDARRLAADEPVDARKRVLGARAWPGSTQGCSRQPCGT